MGWVALFVVTVGIAWVANRQRPRNGWVTVRAACFSSLVFQVMAIWQLGYVDPVTLVAFLASLLITLPLSWAVGWLVWRVRGHNRRGDEI